MVLRDAVDGDVAIIALRIQINADARIDADAQIDADGRRCTDRRSCTDRTSSLPTRITSEADEIPIIINTTMQAMAM